MRATFPTFRRRRGRATFFPSPLAPTTCVPPPHCATKLRSCAPRKNPWNEIPPQLCMCHPFFTTHLLPQSRSQPLAETRLTSTANARTEYAFMHRSRRLCVLRLCISFQIDAHGGSWNEIPRLPPDLSLFLLTTTTLPKIARTSSQGPQSPEIREPSAGSPAWRTRPTPDCIILFTTVNKTTTYCGLPLSTPQPVVVRAALGALPTKYPPALIPWTNADSVHQIILRIAGRAS